MIYRSCCIFGKCLQGGDWDRKNRLRAYEAVYKMSVREFRAAAELFLDAVDTFTSTELISYELLVFYTVVCATYGTLLLYTESNRIASDRDCLCAVPSRAGRGGDVVN